MNLMPQQGAPGFTLPGCCTWRESHVALDFDPPYRVLQLNIGSHV